MFTPPDKPYPPFFATVDSPFPEPIFLIALSIPDDMDFLVIVEGLEPTVTSPSVSYTHLTLPTKWWG